MWVMDTAGQVGHSWQHVTDPPHIEGWTRKFPSTHILKQRGRGSGYKKNIK